MPADPPGNYRPNVAAIISDDAGRILIGERIDVAGAWQFPQGGIDRHEAPEAALVRELAEELSLAPENYEVGEFRGPYRYLFEPGRTKEGFQGQEQTYFRVTLVGSTEHIDLATAHPEFRSIRWIRPEDFSLGWLPPVKRAVYSQVFRDFFGVRLAEPV